MLFFLHASSGQPSQIHLEACMKTRMQMYTAPHYILKPCIVTYASIAACAASVPALEFIVKSCFSEVAKTMVISAR